MTESRVIQSGNWYYVQHRLVDAWLGTPTEWKTLTRKDSEEYEFDHAFKELNEAIVVAEKLAEPRYNVVWRSS